MNPHDEKLPNNPEGEVGPEGLVAPTISTDAAPPLEGDHLPAVVFDAQFKTVNESKYPPDLQISWSWAHFIIFILFGFISLAVVQVVMAIHYGPHEKMGGQELEQFLLAKPVFVIGSMVIWYALIFLFLYVTLAVLRGHPFWQVLGWRKIGSFNSAPPKGPLFFFFGGVLLSVLVAVLSLRMKTPDNAPIEELLRQRQTALLFMGLAVLVAPLVEETLFRGYLYPLFARSFGVWPGIILTGVLFGCMHGAQLGWTFSLVSVLVLVGIIFTFVRARTGSVFASFMMHLGYNSLIAVSAVISTHGFTAMPSQ